MQLAHVKWSNMFRTKFSFLLPNIPNQAEQRVPSHDHRRISPLFYEALYHLNLAISYARLCMDHLITLDKSINAFLIYYVEWRFIKHVYKTKIMRVH